MKQALVFISVLFVFVLSSCLDKNTDERTKETELQELDQYLNDLINNGHNIDTTDLGIYYIRIDTGEGEFPKQGDTLKIGYAGYFIDGSLFDTSEFNVEDGAYTFKFIHDPMIPGFEDGLKLMNEGSKMQLIIPSEFAYGANGSAQIPKYASLIFVTRMLDIKPVAETD